jgi:hypothetical protein
MMLFLDAERTDQDYKRYSESDYEYLDRSARPVAARVRDFLNHWCERYPESHRASLIARMRSTDSREFSSAFFELCLYALLDGLGFKMDVHPTIPSGDEKPDFLVRLQDDTMFYLEAVQASGVSDAQHGVDTIKSTIMDAINDMPSPNFFLGIETEGSPGSSPSRTQLTAKLAKWLERLDPDAVARDFDLKGAGSLPQWEWEHDGWRLTFEAFPKMSEARGRPGHTIIYMGLEPQMLDVGRDIRTALVKKGKHYGVLSHPLLVAVNALSWGLDEDDEIEGIFGQIQFVCSVENLTAPPEIRLRPDGAWTAFGGPATRA